MLPFYAKQPKFATCLGAVLKHTIRVDCGGAGQITTLTSVTSLALPISYHQIIQLIERSQRPRFQVLNLLQIKRGPIDVDTK